MTGLQWSSRRALDNYPVPVIIKTRQSLPTGGADTMKVNRRQFLKVSAGTIGTAVAAEMAGLGLNTSSAQENASKVPIKTGRMSEMP